MTSLMLHEIKKIESETHLLDSSIGRIVWVRNIVITHDTGKITISLFSDDKENLVIKNES